MAAERSSDVAGSPPTYVLVSESALSSTNYSTDFATLVHPVIHYRYADDPPLCTQGFNANFLVMDYDPASPETPTVSSLSSNLAVDNVTISDAPGVIAGSAGSSSGSPSNSNLYIIRTLAVVNEKYPSEEPGSLMAALDLFSQRNAELRKNFEYSVSTPTSDHRDHV